MRGLLLKDFYLLKQSRKTMLIFAFVAGFLLITSGNEVFVLGYINVFIVSIVISVTAYDDYNNGYAFLMTLPVTRREYVQEKYGFGILCSVAGWLFTVIATAISLTARGRMNPEEWFIIWGVFLGIGLMTFSLAQPFSIKYGSEKGRTTMILFLLVIFCVVYFGNKLTKKMGIDLDTAVLKAFDGGVGIAPGAAILLLIVFISYISSVRIMEKKEL